MKCFFKYLIIRILLNNRLAVVVRKWRFLGCWQGVYKRKFVPYK